MSQADAPHVAAAIEAARRNLTRQSIMAVVGLLAVAAFLVFKPGDMDGTIRSLLDILPWLAALSIIVIAANRWTLSLRAKAIRAAAGRT